MSQGDLAARLAGVRERVALAAQRAGRDPADIRLLAVTKGHPAATIAHALSLGLSDIGESRVQEARAKHDALGGGPAVWHMIGRLQRNKARVAAAMFDVVHSVDGAPLALALDRHRPQGMAPLQVLVEVELTGIAGRAGAHPDDLPAVLDALRDCARLVPVGLMTIAPPDAPEAARACFAALRALRERLGDTHGIALRELSMGMSDDFEIAVSEGATLLRLGRILFGDRPPVGPAHGAAILSPT